MSYEKHYVLELLLLLSIQWFSSCIFEKALIKFEFSLIIIWFWISNFDFLLNYFVGLITFSSADSSSLFY